MNLDLFETIVDEFYSLNAIPVFVTANGKTVYHSLPQHILSADAGVLLPHLSPVGITVFGDIEYYATFPFVDESAHYQIIVGPVFSAHPMTIGYKGKLLIEHVLDRANIKNFMIGIAVTGEENFIKYASVVAKMTGNTGFDAASAPRRKVSFQSTLDKSLTEYVFHAREHLLSPYAPETEKRIMDLVKAGDVDAVKKINTAFAADAPGKRVSYLFKVVSFVAICTRAVLDSGVDATVAYGLSDRYLEKLGDAVNNKQISDIAKNVLPHFASLVTEKSLSPSAKYSPHLLQVENYIKVHLHYKITLADAAAAVGISEKYLSRLFVLHKGEKFTKYVNRCRVNEAKELLLNTEHSLTEISYSLGFVSESYFIKIFGEFCNMTPTAYRKRYQNAR